MRTHVMAGTHRRAAVRAAFFQDARCQAMRVPRCARTCIPRPADSSASAIVIAIVITAVLVMTVTVTVPMLVPVLALPAIAIEARLVFLRSHEIHRPVAGVVLVAVLAPVLGMSRGYVQVDR